MKRVLVVEDNANNMRLLLKLLGGNGYETIKAETGEEGVRLAIEEMPDHILMDIKLPGIDGVEATERIRASVGGSKAVIIAITSYAMAGDKEKSLAAGCDGYITKPINPETFVDEVQKYLQVLK